MNKQVGTVLFMFMALILWGQSFFRSFFNCYTLFLSARDLHNIFQFKL